MLNLCVVFEDPAVLIETKMSQDNIDWFRENQWKEVTLLEGLQELSAELTTRDFGPQAEVYTQWAEESNKFTEQVKGKKGKFLVWYVAEDMDIDLLFLEEGEQV